MKSLKIKYKTKIEQIRLSNKLFIFEVIRDLDEAIDQICEEIEEKEDPFAEDLCPYFGLLWPASIALSEYIFENPQLVKGKKVLEIGCGMGFPSLVSSYLGGDVLATDFHPDVEEFFLRNCRHSVLNCSYERMNWREEVRHEASFDVVLGSDILYESKHPGEVAKALCRFLRPGGMIILADPGRSYVSKFLESSQKIGLQFEKHLKEVDGKSVLLYELSKIIETDGHTHNG